MSARRRTKSENESELRELAEILDLVERKGMKARLDEAGRVVFSGVRSRPEAAVALDTLTGRERALRRLLARGADFRETLKAERDEAREAAGTRPNTKRDMSAQSAQGGTP